MKDDSRKPRSVWVTEFNTESVAEFYNDYVDLESDPAIGVIPVFINSYGGQVYSLIAKRDIIKSSEKPTATIALGKAMSCGASLLASGTKGLRFASPDSRILIHQVSSMSRGKASDIREDANQIHSLNEMIIHNLAIDTGMSVAKFKNEIKNRDNTDWVLTTADAIKWGIIDYIGIPRHSYPPMQTDLTMLLKNPKMELNKKKPLKKIKK